MKASNFCYLTPCAALLVSFLAAPLAHGQEDDPFSPGNPAQQAPGQDADPFGNGEAATEKGRREPAPEQPVIWATPIPAAEAKIDKKLRDPLTSVGLEFIEAPLEEVVEFLRDEYELEIQFDRSAMDDLGVDPAEAVTIDVRNVSLGTALRLILRQLKLTYLVEDEMLLITTDEISCWRGVVAIYPVGDLLNEDLGLLEMRGVLIDTVASETWEVNGGEAEIRLVAPGLLLISQSPPIHKEIRSTLTAIRQANQLPQAAAPADAKRSAPDAVVGERTRRRGGPFSAAPGRSPQ